MNLVCFIVMLFLVSWSYMCIQPVVVSTWFSISSVIQFPIDTCFDYESINPCLSISKSLPWDFGSHQIQKESSVPDRRRTLLTPMTCCCRELCVRGASTCGQPLVKGTLTSPVMANHMMKSIGKCWVCSGYNPEDFWCIDNNNKPNSGCHWHGMSAVLLNLGEMWILGGGGV